MRLPTDGKSLHSDEIIVLLSALHEQILAVYEVFGSHDTVERRQLFLVERHSSALNELTHLTLACEHFGFVACEEIHSRLSEPVLRHVE